MPGEQPYGNVKAIFDEAAEIPSTEDRAAYLDRACAGDQELRRKVQTLLQALGEAVGFLEGSPDLLATADLQLGTPADSNSVSGPVQPQGNVTRTDAAPLGEARSSGRPDATGSSGAPRAIEGPGTRIGPYKLLQRIGEGGMGAVYLAEQDRPVRRRVALKVIKPGMDTEQVVARFQAERQALAIMDHPHIAKVFDAGVTDSGRPYFVMELVKGVPITEYCDAVHLTPRERLELFIPVCQAIQHAHQKGIIHRDIKPSNVLIAMQDGKAMPKVIDFGIAKAIDQRLTEQTFFTQHGAIIGTLEYMSPEQAEISAMDIDTRADIYALGVMLYELLTGSTPLERPRLREAGYSEILRRIREEEPPKPSTRLSDSRDSLASVAALRKTEPARLTRLMRGDLDWIVMKAIEKDRTRRYESASGFARDIERHLAGDPVEAGAPGALYRLRKLARKHRAPLVTAALLLLTLMVGIVGTTLGWVEARMQKGIADQQRKKAEERLTEIERVNGLVTAANVQVETRFALAMAAIKSFHTGVARDVLLKHDNLKPVRDRLLNAAAEFYQRLEGLLANQADRKSRRALAEAYREMARLAGEIGATDQSLASLRQAVRVIREMAESASADRDFVARDDATYGIGLTLTNLGNLLRETGHMDEARTSYEEARTLLENLQSAHPDVAMYKSDLATAYNNIANVLFSGGKPREALESHERARAIWNRLVDASPNDATFQNGLAMSLGNIANSLHDIGKLNEALAMHQASQGIRQKLSVANPDDDENQLLLAREHHNIGQALADTTERANALASFQAERTILQKLVDANPAVTRFHHSLARSLNAIGWEMSKTGRPSEALAACQEALEIFRKLVDSNPTLTDLRVDLAGCIENLATFQSLGGQPEKALVTYRSASEIFEKLADANPTVESFQQQHARCQISIGVLLFEAGKPEEALVPEESALAIMRKLVSANPMVPAYQGELAEYQRIIGSVQNQLGKTAEALESYQAAQTILQRLVDANPRVVRFQLALASNLNQLGILLKQSGDLKQALKSCKASREIRQTLADANPGRPVEQLNLANDDLEIGDIFVLLGQPLEASRSFEKALALLERLQQSNPKMTEYLTLYRMFGLKGLAATQQGVGRTTDAVANWRSAIAMTERHRSPGNELLFYLAGCHARLGASASLSGSGVSATEGQAELDRAMETLQRAIAGGYRNVDSMKREPDLVPLHARSDFQALIMDLEFPAESFSKDSQPHQ